MSCYLLNPENMKLPGVSCYKDRHGKLRWRFRQRGYNVELGCDPKSLEFVQRYQAAKAGPGSGRHNDPKDVTPGSVAALIAEYYSSSAFTELQPSTKAAYRGVIEPFREAHGEKQVSTLRRRHVRKMIEAKRKTPSAANNLRSRLCCLLDLAVELEWRDNNPARLVRPLRKNTLGFHAWTEEEILQFYKRHSLGSMAHTAMTLMLYTGASRADAVRLGPANVVDGRLQYARRKTARFGVTINIPLHFELEAALATCLPRQRTFLETRAGQARSAAGLGNQMRKWCDQAGLPHCTSHGLRKAIARRLAEAGASAHEIMAVTGHQTLSEVTRYTASVNRKLLADNGLSRLESCL